MKHAATSVSEYLNSLPQDRREAMEAVRRTIKENLGEGFEEGIQYGMIGYYVPHSEYPDGYHCDPKQPLPYAHLGSQKHHMGIYLMCIYGRPEHEAWFRKAWTATGKKLDMGKSCIRFKTLEDVPLEVVGEAIRRVPLPDYLAHYEANVRTGGKRSRSGTAKAAGKKSAPKKSSANKKAAKKKSVKRGSKSATGKRSSTGKASARTTVKTSAASKKSASQKTKPNATKKAATKKKTAPKKKVAKKKAAAKKPSAKKKAATKKPAAKKKASKKKAVKKAVVKKRAVKPGAKKRTAKKEVAARASAKKKVKR